MESRWTSRQDLREEYTRLLNVVVIDGMVLKLCCRHLPLRRSEPALPQ